MNKLIFKLFYLNFGLFVFAAVLLSGCSLNMTGRMAEQVPAETSRNPLVYFCPEDDCGKVFENYIDSANNSVYCAFYDLDLKNIITSLSRKSKSADVKLVMDSSNYKKQAVGDGVKLDNDKQLMHNKFCAIDGSIVITGSFNPTYNDNARNNNNVIVIYSSRLAKNYEDEFNELWGGKFGGGSLVKYPILHVNRMKIENYFCPEDCQSSSYSVNNGRAINRIIDLIKNANESVQVASFTFTHKEIADELLKAQAEGVNATLLTEGKQRNVKDSQYQRLRDSKFNIRLDGNKYNMHHKFIIIDGRIVITGSPNFTWGGINKNDENMLIIYDEGIALRYVEEFNKLYDSGT